MNVNWLFIAVGMHRSSTLLIACWLSIICQLLDRGSKDMLVFLEEKLKAPITHFSLICKFLDQIQNCPIQYNKVKKTEHSNFSKINVCLIMTGNDRLEKVTPSLELVRISNHAIKGMIEANYWKNRSKLFQPSEINHVV